MNYLVGSHLHDFVPFAILLLFVPCVYGLILVYFLISCTMVVKKKKKEKKVFGNLNAFLIFGSLQILDYFEYALFRTGQNWMLQQDDAACHIQCQY